MTELFFEIVFWVAPWIFIIGGISLGWTLNTFFRERRLKKLGKDYND